MVDTYDDIFSGTFLALYLPTEINYLYYNVNVQYSMDWNYKHYRTSEYFILQAVWFTKNVSVLASFTITSLLALCLWWLWLFSFFAACNFYPSSWYSLRIHKLWLWQTEARVPQNKWQSPCLGKGSFKGWRIAFMIYSRCPNLYDNHDYIYFH